MNIVINAKLKDFLQKNKFEKVFLIRGKRAGLYMFPKKEWLQMGKKLRQQLGSKAASDLLDTLIKGTNEIDLKKHGFMRIPIPAYLVKWSGLKKNVVGVCCPEMITFFPDKSCLPENKGSPLIIEGIVS